MPIPNKGVRVSNMPVQELTEAQEKAAWGLLSLGTPLKEIARITGYTDKRIMRIKYSAAYKDYAQKRADEIVAEVRSIARTQLQDLVPLSVKRLKEILQKGSDKSALEGIKIAFALGRLTDGSDNANQGSVIINLPSTPQTEQLIKTFDVTPPTTEPEDVS